MSLLAQTFELALRQHQAGNLQQAEALYRQILSADPTHVDALHLLGVIAGQWGRPEIAVAYIRQALSVKPDFALAHKNLGKYLEDQGKLDEAAASYLQALRCQPDFAEAHFNLGNVYREQNRPKEAAECYRQALHLDPDHADAHNNLGIVLREFGQLDDAADHFSHALRLKPDHFLAFNNMGVVLQEQGKLDEAEKCFRDTIRLEPNFVGALNNLGCIFRDQGKLSESAEAFLEAIRLKPDFADAHSNLGRVCLQMGDFEKGWAEYEWIRQKATSDDHKWPQPFWKGESLVGQTILIRPEQGLGDNLQFVRYASLVKKLGAKVLFECPAELFSIIQTCPGIDQVLAQNAPLPPFDVQIFLMSLPGILNDTVDTLPASVPYLSSDSNLTLDWQDEIKQFPEFKIGIVWQGNPRFSQLDYRMLDKRRSIPLAQFEPLACVRGVRLFSLQKGYGSEQLVDLKSRCVIVEMGDRLKDFMDTAAVMMNMDLIISVDSSPAHLAGALGRPVWTVLPFASCWRWLHDRDDSPWYPTMRLFRQSKAQKWEEVFCRIVRELDKMISGF